MKFSTKAIHTGQKPDESTGAIIPPIYLTSTFKQNFPGDIQHGIYDYTRAYNPNFTNLEETIAALEGGTYATVFSSGLGALTAIFSTLNPQDHIIAVDDLYGGTYRLFDKFFKKFGITYSLVDTQNLSALEAIIKKTRPSILLVESPTNPFLKISDIKTISSIAHKQNTKVVVDNTFASPYIQQPLLLDADIVIHSTTKYIGGHSDIIGGAVITNNSSFKEQMDYHRKVIGLNPSPFDTWMISRGIKTLALRMEKHSSNAFHIATFLEKHPLIKKVYYPFLPTHNNYSIAKKQMKAGSGIVSIEFDLSYEKVKRLVSSFHIITLAESLGGVESLVDHPASMTHAGIPEYERKKMGLSDSLIRLSVGIEDSEDILEDIDHGLKHLY